MASILCRNGSEHRHSSVPESRACWTIGRNPFAGSSPAGVKPETSPVYTAPVPFVPGPVKMPPAPVEVTEGFWIVEDEGGKAPEFFKIQMSGRSERLYGKKLEGESFEYFANAPRYVSANWGRKLTAEDAKWFGKLYGRCMICGRTLENEESIANGIGPVCADKL